MHVCARGHGGEEELAEPHGEGVAHCVDEDIGDEERKGFKREDERAERLAEEGEVWPGGGEDPVAGGEVEEVQCAWIKCNVEAVLLFTCTC